MNDTDTNYDVNDEQTENFSLIDTKFDLDDEYKEDPLAPQGTYNGVVKNVEFESRNNCISWNVVATHNTGITLLDGNTPIDGTEYYYRNWLPKPGDEKIKSKNGKATKRQTKINMLKKFQDRMQVDMNTAAVVLEAIENAEWIGISVVFNLEIDTYKGNTRNQINSMQRSDEEFDTPEYAEDVSDDDIPF